MRKIKVVALILGFIVGLAIFTGCSAVNWDNIKNNDVLATVNGREVQKIHVAYQNAEDTISKKISASMFQQMGLGDAEDDKGVDMDTSFRTTMEYYIIGEYAHAQGFGYTEEEAYDKAYNEYILLEKKGGYDYITQYNDQLKEVLYFDDDMLVKYGAEKIYYRQAVTEYIKSLLEQYQYDYPDDEDLTTAVSTLLKQAAATIDVQFTKHDKGILKELDYKDLISNAMLSFNRDSEEK